MDQEHDAVTRPVATRRMLIAGVLAPTVAEQIACAYPELELRTVPDGPLADGDSLWADAYIGRRLPDNIADSSITWVHTTTAGVDTAVPILRALPRPVLLTRTVGDMPRKIALYVLAYVLADAHRLAGYREQQARREWCRLEPPRMDGAVATVLGTGAIGAEVAEVLQGAGFVAHGVNRSGHERTPFARTAAMTDPKAAPGETAVLVNTLPLTPETEGRIGMSVFERLQGVLFVNVGRGDTVALSDLRQALELGHVRHAVLDVLPVEPPLADAWFWDHPQVTLTPHVAAVTDAEDVLRDLSAALDDLRAGHTPRNAVDLTRGY